MTKTRYLQRITVATLKSPLASLVQEEGGLAGFLHFTQSRKINGPYSPSVLALVCQQLGVSIM